MASSDETLLFRTKTPFQTIELARINDGSIALYLDNAIQFVTGLDDQIYHNVLASLPARMLMGKLSRALILGGGDGLVARNLLLFPNIRSITMVELDPEMIKFSSTNPIMRRINLDAFKNPRLKVIAGDAKEFVKRNPPGPNFDLAILDFPDPLDRVLEDLFTEKLYREVMAQMNVPRAVVSIQASAAYSDTEDQVRKNIARATMTKPITIRFKGNWMMDGAVIIAGQGVVPSLAMIPDEWKSEPEAPDIAPKRRITVLF